MTPHDPPAGATLSSASLRVVVEVMNGAYAGRKAWLRAGQVLKIGRTERADFVVPYDKGMSSLHFTLECALGSCKIRDDQSANGTQVNGQPISEAMLHQGDVVQAGTSKFQITLEGASALAGDVDGQPPAAAKIHPTPPPPSKQPPRYKVVPGFSKLLTLTGDAEAPSPVQIAHLLTKIAPLYMSCDFHFTALEKPPELKEPEYLFDWLPPDARPDASPVVLDKNDPAELYQVLEANWGKGGVVCYYSSRDKQAVLSHLRGVLQGRKKPDGGVARNSMSGVCWPGVLRPVLENAMPGSQDFFLSHFELLFMEGEEPNQWVLFAQPSLEAKLQKIGFAKLPDEDPAPPAG